MTPFRRLWCCEPDLKKDAVVLARVTGARLLVTREPPSRFDGIVIATLNGAHADRARRVAIDRNVPLIVVARAPVTGPRLHAFLGATVWLSLPLPVGSLVPDAGLADLLLTDLLTRAGETARPPVGEEDPIEAGVKRALGEVLGRSRRDADPLPACAALGRAVVWPSPYDARTTIRADLASLCLRAMRGQAALVDRSIVCFGAKHWNQPSIRSAFSAPGNLVHFVADGETAFETASRTGGRILGWAAAVTREHEARAVQSGISLWRIEDGFLRSVGLGAGLAPGAALAFDDLGIYFDGTRPSRMETLLTRRTLTPAERLRAKSLLAKLTAARVTKYNTGVRSPLPPMPENQQIILVPGQVADDAGVLQSGSALIPDPMSENVNLALLKLVRARNPSAYIVFKTHPDVEAGLRRGGVGEADIRAFADMCLRGGDILDWIDRADRVETFSSLAGFEALIRGTPVTVHATPFYAGWGLTEDTTPMPRRERRLDLETLVHVAFIDYAISLDPVSRLPCAPEFLIERFVTQRLSRRHRIWRRLQQEASWLGRKLGF